MECHSSALSDSCDLAAVVSPTRHVWGRCIGYRQQLSDEKLTPQILHCNSLQPQSIFIKPQVCDLPRPYEPQVRSPLPCPTFR